MLFKCFLKDPFIGRQVEGVNLRLESAGFSPRLFGESADAVESALEHFERESRRL